MDSFGKQLGPNFISRLLKVLPWAEGQMGKTPPLQWPTPQILQPPSRRVFELDDILALGSTASATLFEWDPAADSGVGDYVTTSETITVSDTLGHAWGLAGERGVTRMIRSDIGEVWQVVENPGHHFYWGKLDGDLTAGGSATVSVWTERPLADTIQNLTVYAPPLLTTGSLASGDWVKIEPAQDGTWYATGAEC